MVRIYTLSPLQKGEVLALGLSLQMLFRRSWGRACSLHDEHPIESSTEHLPSAGDTCTTQTRYGFWTRASSSPITPSISKFSFCCGGIDCWRVFDIGEEFVICKFRQDCIQRSFHDRATYVLSSPASLPQPGSLRIALRIGLSYESYWG